MSTKRPGQQKRAGLDQPLDRSRGPRVGIDAEAFGARSERIARYIGSWSFIMWMTVAIVAWVLWNTLAPEDLRPDPFPFIFLTLLLSLQASYAAPLILLAQNRQSDRDRVQYSDDRMRNDRLIADTEYLARELAALRLALGEMATRDFLRSELRDLLEELEDSYKPPPAKKKRRNRPEARPKSPEDDDWVPDPPQT